MTSMGSQFQGGREGAEGQAAPALWALECHIVSACCIVELAHERYMWIATAMVG